MTEGTLAPFYEKFRVDELLIFRSRHWSWSVRPVHSTLGAGVLSLNRYCEAMADLSEGEGADLSLICRVLERALHRFTAPDRMNYVMLMMVDSHLHFHVLPRYEQDKEFGGRTWHDNGWPALPAMADNPEVASATLSAIRESLRANLGDVDQQ